MNNTLYILDLLPFVHAGHVNKRSVLTRVEDLGSRVHSVTTPTGGASLVMNALYDIVGTGDIVICSDRRPTIKQDMFADYKANRFHNNDITIERKAAEYILEKCGLSVLYYAGYEADDIIYTLVQKLHNSYEEIFIYTGDSDLYFLVDGKVSIRPTSTRGKTVTLETYEKTPIKGRCYRYNSITMSKICGGDSSDNIPCLPDDVWKKFADNMFAEPLYPHMGNKETIRYWISMLCPEALSQFDLVFPLDVPDVPLTFSTPSISAIRNWGSAINNKMFRGTGDPSFDVKPYVEEMQITLGIYVEEMLDD